MMRSWIFATLLIAASACRTTGNSSAVKDDDAAPSDSDDSDDSAEAASGAGALDYVTSASLFITPSPAGHQPVIDVINNATQSIHMEMFHLDDKNVVQALIAASGRGLDVKVIVDRSGITSSTALKASYNKLKASNVSVRASSSAFPITHAKALEADGTQALIMSINMTNAFATTRDFGLVVTTPAVVSDVSAVFDQDWAQADTGGGASPTLQSKATVLSPVNSQAKLTALIKSATSSLILTVENLDDPAIVSALTAAAGRGVAVQVMVPMCDQNPNPLLNYPSLNTLAQAGIETRVMPYPPTATQPYMHAKMIVADGAHAYVGSVNYSPQSLTKARELGVLFSDADAISQIAATFAADWEQAVPTPVPPPTTCPAST